MFRNNCNFEIWNGVHPKRENCKTNVYVLQETGLNSELVPSEGKLNWCLKITAICREPV